MLSREKRLRNEKDIQLVFKKGRSIFDKFCGIKFSKNGKELSRMTVVVGSKIDKSAVVRNRLKRQYRAIMHEIWGDLEMGFDIILLPSKNSIEIDFQKKREELLKVLNKAKLC